MRVALAGSGHWHSAMHLDAALQAGANVVGAWDPDRAVEVAQRAGVPVVDTLDLLLDMRPDLVVVMGNPVGVPAVTRACFDAGIPILLEKPAAAATIELEALAAYADQRVQFVAVPFANRCSPIWSELDRLRHEGRAGAISHAQFRVINGPPSRYHEEGVGWMLDQATAGGGAMRNLGLHGVDAALVLFGDSEPRVVGAETRSVVHGEAVEEYAIATLAVPGGPVVTVEAGYTFASLAPGGDFEWRVSAANAYLVDRGTECRVTTLDDGEVYDVPALPAAERYRAFMAETLECLRQGAPPRANLRDYVRAMRVIDRIYAVAGR